MKKQTLTTLKKALPLALLTASMPTISSAQLMIADNFDSATTGINDNLGTRQSGTLATTNWLVGETGGLPANQQIVTNQLSLKSSNASAYESNARLDLDFASAGALLSGGAFEVSFDVTAIANGAYAAFSIGSSDSLLSDRPIISASTDFGVLLRSNDSGNVFSAGSNVETIASPGWSSGLAAFNVTTANFNSGTAYTITMSVGGTSIDLNGGAAGNDFTGTWDAGGTNYMYLSGRGPGDIRFDNFSVTAIPEPSSVALLFGISCGLFAVTRRRKTAD